MRLSTFHTIWYFLKPYPGRIGLITALVLLYAALEGASLGALYFLLNSTVGNEGAVSPATSLRFEYVISGMPVDDPIIAICVILIALVTLKAATGYLSQVMGAFTGYRIWEDNQLRIFKKYMDSDYLRFLEKKQGEIVYQVYTAPSFLGAVFNIVPQLAVEILKMLVIVGVLFSMSARLSSIIMVFTLAFFFITKYTAKNVSYHFGQGRVNAGNKQNILISEMCNGFRQIKLFMAQARWTAAFQKALRDYFILARKDSICLAVPKHFLDFLFMSGLALVIISLQLSNPGALRGMLPVFGVFVYGFMRIAPSLNVFSNNLMQVMGVLPNLETLREVMEKNMVFVQDGERVVGFFEKSIQFQNLSFTYPGRAKVLDRVSLEFAKGRHSAIIGPSGAGKTTVFDLIIRLFDPQEGVVLIDGVNLKEIKLASWLSRVSYVSQDTFVFNGSVFANIAFGAIDVGYQDVERAARDANAYDFIMQLPEKFDTVIGDKGLNLSGGQRQRLAIARALLRNPDILFLDEATSALDSQSEAQVREAIRRVSKTRTVISIAHRLSTIKDADVIYVLEGGKIVESGRHEELLLKGGRYKHYYEAQTRRPAVVEEKV